MHYIKDSRYTYILQRLISPRKHTHTQPPQQLHPVCTTSFHVYLYVDMIISFKIFCKYCGVGEAANRIQNLPVYRRIKFVSVTEGIPKKK